MHIINFYLVTCSNFYLTCSKFYKFLFLFSVYNFTLYFNQDVESDHRDIKRSSKKVKPVTSVTRPVKTTRKDTNLEDPFPDVFTSMEDNAGNDTTYYNSCLMAVLRTTEDYVSEVSRASVAKNATMKEKFGKNSGTGLPVAEKVFGNVSMNNNCAAEGTTKTVKSVKTLRAAFEEKQKKTVRCCRG